MQKMILKIQRNGQINYRGYFDFQNNTYSSEDIETSNFGRLQGYSLLLQVYNDTSSKELKGLELPAGDITFDFELNEYGMPRKFPDGLFHIKENPVETVTVHKMPYRRNEIHLIIEDRKRNIAAKRISSGTLF